MSGGAVKPVDEDLYKIPPELLHEKSKKVLHYYRLINKFFFIVPMKTPPVTHQNFN